MIKNTSLAMGLAAALALLSGCGAGEANPAPDGSTITIYPTSKKWDTAADPTCPNGLVSNDTPFAITVKDANGTPLNDIGLILSLDLSVGQFSGPAVLELWDGGTRVTTYYKTKTDAAGTKIVTVRMWMGCSYGYKGQLSAFSGTAFGASDLEVTVLQ